jgi:hypothetical protein
MRATRLGGESAPSALPDDPQYQVQIFVVGEDVLVKAARIDSGSPLR